MEEKCLITPTEFKMIEKHLEWYNKQLERMNRRLDGFDDSGRDVVDIKEIIHSIEFILNR